MNIYPYLLDILKYFIAGIGVVSATYYIIKPHIERSEKVQLLEFKRTLNAQTLPLRLQAYERLVLFIERVNPSSMLIRLNGSDYSAGELHSIVVNEIRNEYQHNVTQQIYVSPRAWGVMRRVKDDTMSIVTNAIKGLPEEASGMDLSRTVLMHLSKLEDNPYDIALAMIRRDLEDLF
ncbi:DUF7935 family protein [Mucilaginibacter paludis]|uniref:Uncharacterized protein n=1 Tax=Mucilaginibacter paludis DSM 18603 TaxID=714943 RepID=H1YGK5_9SPHI|nr:hypothetical protein [Mucilaginibacter paludis]EHQ25391.1 hypothetical protein Mucpa_1227 [Mucilaginibacter paludis DSM 18603]